MSKICGHCDGRGIVTKEKSGSCSTGPAGPREDCVNLIDVECWVCGGTGNTDKAMQAIGRLTEDQKEVLLELTGLRGELKITVELNEKLRAKNAKLRAMLKKHRWSGDWLVDPDGHHYRGCIECGEAEVQIIDGEACHNGNCDPDCELAKLLEEE